MLSRFVPAAMSRPPGRLIIACAGGALALVAAAGCSSSTSTTPTSGSSGHSAPSGGTLTIGITAANVPPDINPAKTNAVASQMFFQLAYQPLLEIEDNSSFGPGLATSWSYLNSTRTEFQLTIRSGVKFSDGTPLDAAAVASWLNYFTKAGGPNANGLGQVVSIKATSATQVVITLSAPNPSLLWELAQTHGEGYVASTGAVGAPAELSSGTYGAGPYVYDASASVPNNYYTFTPNRYYYDKSAVKYSQVVLKVIANSSSMVQAMISGQVQVGVGDYTGVSAATSAGLKVVGGVQSWDGLVFMQRGGAGNPLASAQVRQALNYAINRPLLTQGLIDNQGFATSEWVTLDGYDKSYVNYYSYNVAKAKQLLAAAGYPNGVTITVVDATGQATDGTPSDGLTQALAQEMKPAGITLKITSLPATQLLSAALSGKYEAANLCLGINQYGTYIPIFVSPAALLNLSKVSDPTINSLTTQYGNAADPGSIAEQATRYVTAQGFNLPVYATKTILFVSPKVTGVAFPLLPTGLAYGVGPDPTAFAPAS